MRQPVTREQAYAYLARRIDQIKEEARRSGKRFKTLRELSVEQGVKPINATELKAIIAELNSIKDEDDPLFFDDEASANALR